MSIKAAKLFKLPVFSRSVADDGEMDASLLDREEKYWTWMPVPDPKPGSHADKAETPAGLECYQDAEELWVCQHKSLKDDLKFADAKVRFSVRDGERQMIHFVEEKSRTEDRMWWGKDREFTFYAKNEALEDCISFHRPWKSKAALFSWLNTESCGWVVEVAAKGVPIGAVKQVNSGFHKRFDLVNGRNEVLLHIKGPFIEGRLFTEDVDFELFQADRKTPAGKISLKWGGIKKDLLDSQQFKIKTKAEVGPVGRVLAIGATFLIRFMCTDRA